MTSRILLCVGLAAAASGCSFAPCDSGCTAVYRNDDWSLSNASLTCEAAGVEVNVSIPVTSCEKVAPEGMVTSTPGVCEVTDTTLWAGEVTCLGVGVCTVSVNTSWTERDCMCDSNDLPGWALAVIISGGVLLLILAAVLLYTFMKRTDKSHAAAFDPMTAYDGEKGV